MSRDAEILQAVHQTLRLHGHNPSAIFQLRCLLGSLGDTLSDDEVLEGIQDLANHGTVWRSVYAEPDPD